MTRMVMSALVALLASSPVAVRAQVDQDADTLRLDAALWLARSANPMLQAARLRADAAAERIPQSGAWYDPQLTFGLLNRPVADLGNTDQPMTMNSVTLTQRFAWPGKLGFGAERAEHLARADSLEAEEVERGLLARVKSAYYQLAFMDRALIVMSDTRQLLRDFLEVSSARYAVGSGLQQDVLQAQVSIAQMTEDITVMEQDRIAMAARLNALLGRAATSLVGALELPAPGDALPAMEELMDTAVARRPALSAARQRVLAAEAGYRAARRALYPDLTVGLGYGQRPQFDDFFTVIFGISIPVFAGSRQLPQRREMQAMQLMEEARERDLYNETFAQLAELRAQAERARKLSSLYATSVLPQAQAAVESALSAYRVGRIDYTTLVVNEMTVNRYQIESVRLTAEYHRAVAEVEAMMGTTLGGDK
ncbi:MAG: TolC family protein [Gemmatimonadota bacterium]|nr:MAG: TolC family protein [Gemmatimonadota bacterium]